MSLYRFNLTVPAFDARFAVTGGTSGKLVGSKQMPLVNIQNGTAIDTVDPVTMRAIEDWMGLPAQFGFTVQKGVSGSRTVDYDAASAAAKAGR